MTFSGTVIPVCLPMSNIASGYSKIVNSRLT